LAISPPAIFWAPREVAIDAFHRMVHAVATGMALELLSNAPGAHQYQRAQQGELRSLPSPGDFVVAARKAYVRRASPWLQLLSRYMNDVSKVSVVPGLGGCVYALIDVQCRA